MRAAALATEPRWHCEIVSDKYISILGEFIGVAEGMAQNIVDMRVEMSKFMHDTKHTKRMWKRTIESIGSESPWYKREEALLSKPKPKPKTDNPPSFLPPLQRTASVKHHYEPRASSSVQQLYENTRYSSDVDELPPIQRGARHS